MQIRPSFVCGMYGWMGNSNILVGNDGGLGECSIASREVQLVWMFHLFLYTVQYKKESREKNHRFF